MRRLNVQFTQIEECIEKALFAVDGLPRNPPLEPGEFLLLQLTQQDAKRLGKLASRIEFALIFDHVVPDPTGEISRRHWPLAGKTWRYILVCNDTVPAIPFSLESLSLREGYAGQSQCVFIQPGDAEVIRTYFTSEVSFERPPRRLDPAQILQTIRNYDKVIRLSATRTTKVSEHVRRLNDPWPGDALKTFYDHKCQICTHDFRPRYGTPHAETRFLRPPEKGGSLESANRLVVCPNHDGIISVAKPKFDRSKLAFEYRNGLVEEIVLKDHLIA